MSTTHTHTHFFTDWHGNPCGLYRSNLSIDWWKLSAMTLICHLVCEIQALAGALLDGNHMDVYTDSPKAFERVDHVNFPTLSSLIVSYSFSVPISLKDLTLFGTWTHLPLPSFHLRVYPRNCFGLNSIQYLHIRRCTWFICRQIIVSIYL